jgi:hypothetical protein
MEFNINCDHQKNNFEFIEKFVIINEAKQLVPSHKPFISYKK